MMKELVFLLEERSAEALLRGLLPRMGVDMSHCRFIVFEGKQDLEKNITRKIRGYINPSARFLVMRDQDSHPDCVALKQVLLGLCDASGRIADCVVRIACRELESFYLADLKAVETALGVKGLSAQQGVKKFREPDYLVSPSKELAALTKGKYQKVSGSRQISAFLDLNNERSASFKNLITGVQKTFAF